MSTFWDSIKADTKPYPGKTATNTAVSVTLETVWDSIPEQSLEELSSECVHYFTIPTGQREVIGQCNKCQGERWFKNYYEEQKFNSYTTAEQLQAYSDAQQSSGELIPDIMGAIA